MAATASATPRRKRISPRTARMEGSFGLGGLAGFCRRLWTGCEIRAPIGRVEFRCRVVGPMIGLQTRSVVVGARSCFRTGGRRLGRPQEIDRGRNAGYGNWGGNQTARPFKGLERILDSAPGHHKSIAYVLIEL